MPAVALTWADIKVFAPDVSEAQATALITGALARAALIAPCIKAVDFAYADAAKSIVLEIILRRIESGSGVLAMEQAGPYQVSYDTRTSPRTLFQPGEIAELQRLCEASAASTDGGTALPRWNFPAIPYLPVVAPMSEHGRRAASPWPDPAYFA